MLRKHQAQMVSVVNNIISGQPIKYVLALVCPGGGKSALPMIAGRLIPAGLADKLCWVVPRKSLQRQGERNFVDPFFRRMFDHSLTIRSSTNDENPCRGLDGFVTTYNAIGVDSKRTVLRDFQKRRYILVLDEFHHVEQGDEWHIMLKPLASRAVCVLLMTGTCERGDGSKIAFLPYTQHLGRTLPVLESSDQLGLQVIKYTRTDALAEKAIIPLNFHFADGSATWREKHSNAKIHYDSIAGAKKKDAAAALYTAVSTKFAAQLMGLGLSHWNESRFENPDGKMLVVTAGIRHARSALKYLAGYRAEIATSHESKNALAAIEAYKAGDIDILVTIAMAYEGLDVPAINHIVSLTHYRSRPWIEQMLARGVRVDHAAGPWNGQVAQVFTPDDPLMRELVAKIELEQAPFVKEERGVQLGLFGEMNEDEEGEEKNPFGIIPIESAMTRRRNKILGPDPAAPIPSGPVFERAPSEKEADLRERIESHVRAFSYHTGRPYRYLNGEIARRMGKSRENMTIGELSRCLEHVRRTYPLIQKRAYQL